MKDEIKILALNFLLDVYNETELSNLLNNDIQISSIISSIILEDFNTNNDIAAITPSINGDLISYSIGGNYQLSKTDVLTKVFLQLSDITLLKLVLAATEKLNK